ncbi:MAG: hypothetical protein ACI8W8_004602, partial [Rhodothermales bacterium]
RMKQKDIKLLWGGRAGNRCSICQIELSQEAGPASFNLGQQAHIVGEKASAARGHSALSLADRNCYHNIILLCPCHHTEIDANETAWSVEQLHSAKSKHELWVTETLAVSVDPWREAEKVALASIIDSAVRLCRLETWSDWTSEAMCVEPSWLPAQPNEIYEFRLHAAAAIWPQGFEELRCATQLLALRLGEACSTFMEHSTLKDGRYEVDKFYKSAG